MQLEEALRKLHGLNAAVTDALANEVADEAKTAVKEAAKSVVYSYTPQFLSRREENGGLIDEANIITTADGDTLTVENVTGLQNLWGGSHTEPLTPVITAGKANYNMPYPRPFMDEAKNLLMSGRAENALRRGLARHGYSPSGTGLSFD